MRALICGGRDYRDHLEVNRFLDLFHSRKPISMVIEGGASGADSFARQWAQRCGIPVVTFWANWTGERKSAGPIRNQRMLDLLPPNVVIAFPGGRGTQDMVNKAIAARIRVVDVAATYEL